MLALAYFIEPVDRSGEDHGPCGGQKAGLEPGGGDAGDGPARSCSRRTWSKAGLPSARDLARHIVMCWESSSMEALEITMGADPCPPPRSGTRERPVHSLHRSARATQRT